MMKKRMSRGMSREKKAVINSRNRYSASTWPAMVEACWGNSGKFDGIDSVFLVQTALPGCQLVAAEHDDHESAQQQNGGRGADPQNVENRRSILTLGWIVVVAIQQHFVHHVPNLAPGRFNQSQLYIPGRVFNPVVVLGHAAIWREQHDAAGVRELLNLRVPRVTEAHGLGQRVNLVFAAGQDMPALL